MRRLLAIGLAVTLLVGAFAAGANAAKPPQVTAVCTIDSTNVAHHPRVSQLRGVAEVWDGSLWVLGACLTEGGKGRAKWFAVRVPAEDREWFEQVAQGLTGPTP